ncbi:hypothetical protein SAMN05428988_3803 [Chitinophaga sp. YR573]|uniref:helix-turn-helix domain-containing protein n=1 Tax=Chitinophaga sp. YR573 TaxID=1881040 RepID=UPI0008D48691|nr:helix-turn-helix transcriptional regulator [Chitinophaga sp. YR573]SEW26863.1 hypothetical protein SAMN05428988_3803 [Chitinophaga sp. YR573]
MKREELLRSREYWLMKIQNGIFNLTEQYIKNNNLNKTQLAVELGVTREYISDVLNGDFDDKISKLVYLSLAMNKVPVVSYIDMNECLSNDAVDGGAK